jgi:uncharacterized protein YciI
VFVVTLTYAVEPARVRAASDAHLAWVDRQFDAGVFVASGRSVPRTGGVIMARGVSREEQDRLLATDPFAEQALVTYDVKEFEPRRAAPGLEELLA